MCSSWVGFCFTRIQETLIHSYKVLYAKLRKDPRFAQLDSSPPPPGHFSILRFLENELIDAVWHSRSKIYLPTVAGRQIRDITWMLRNAHPDTWSKPICGIIPRSCDLTQYGDSSLRGAGGYCHQYKFFIFMQWPLTVQRLTVLHMRSPKISINDLEFATAIILIAGVCVAWSQDNSDTKLYQPRIQHFIDNTAAESWLKKPTVSSPVARRLTSVLCGILAKHPAVTIDPVYIPTKEKKLADAISRLYTPPEFLTFA